MQGRHNGEEQGRGATGRVHRVRPLLRHDGRGHSEGGAKPHPLAKAYGIQDGVGEDAHEACDGIAADHVPRLRQRRLPCREHDHGLGTERTHEQHLRRVRHHEVIVQQPEYRNAGESTDEAVPGMLQRRLRGHRLVGSTELLEVASDLHFWLFLGIGGQPGTWVDAVGCEVVRDHANEHQNHGTQETGA